MPATSGEWPSPGKASIKPPSRSSPARYGETPPMSTPSTIGRWSTRRWEIWVRRPPISGKSSRSGRLRRRLYPSGAPPCGDERARPGDCGPHQGHRDRPPVRPGVFPAQSGPLRKAEYEEALDDVRRDPEPPPAGPLRVPRGAPGRLGTRPAWKTLRIHLAGRKRTPCTRRQSRPRETDSAEAGLDAQNRLPARGGPFIGHRHVLAGRKTCNPDRNRL